jgi:hypothetical protein
VRHGLDEAGADRIGNVHKDYRDRARGLLQRRDRYAAHAENHIRFERDQLVRIAAKPFAIVSDIAVLEFQIAANRPSQLLKGLLEQVGPRLGLRIVRPKKVEDGDDARARPAVLSARPATAPHRQVHPEIPAASYGPQARE